MADLTRLEDLEPQPVGFGRCGECPYRESGTIRICYACARSRLDVLPESRCQVCELALDSQSGQCGNPVCGWADRKFTWNRAISFRTNELKAAISRYKYDGKWGWSLVFGRVLAGFLNENRKLIQKFDAIIPSPTYTGPGGRAFDHTQRILKEAARLDDGTLPFSIQDPLIAKVRATRSLASCKTWQERADVCSLEIGPAMTITNGPAISGKRILVFDDVFTDGLNINTVASVLRAAGCREVCQVTLAREPWKR